MTSCPPADLWSICSLYFWWFSWRKTKPSIIWPYHSFISYAILQLILRPALHLLIYFKILVFLVVTVAHSYPFIKYSVKRWTKPSITFTMMTSNFEANYSSDTEANSKSGFETVVIANCILNAPLMLLSIIGNALVLVAILKTPSLQFGCFRSSCGIGGTTSLYSSWNSKNRPIFSSSRHSGICWVRRFPCDDDSHNSGSFLSSPLSPAVPKFNDNKPGNLYNNNYLVYYHVILFFNSLVAEYSVLSCSFL